MTLSLRKRITLLSISMMTIALLLLTLLFTQREQRFITRLNEINRRHLTETFAISITNSLLYEEMGLIEEGGLIENYIEEWMQKKDLPIRYIRVMNRRGRIFASDDLSEYGIRPDDSLSQVIRSSTTTLAHYLDREGSDPVLEISTPLNISTRYWGHLRIGYSLTPLNREIAASRRNHAIIAMIMIAVSGVIFIIYLHRAIAPLVRLRDFVEQAATESWLRYPIDRHDEIGDLARTFNLMLDRMEQGRELERETRDKFYRTEKMSTIGKLAAGVAHEVRNPLAGIQNLVENLERYRLHPDRQHQYIQVIRDGLRRIEKTVDSLVSFARQQSFSPAPVKPADIIEHALALAAYPVRKGRIEVVKKIEPDLPKIVADPDQLHQVMLNIILNALQAMEDSGGRLTITVRREGEDHLAFAVEDTGVGIPKESMKRIFDPFYTTMPTGEGTGLGLAVSHTIVQRHGGRIEVHSEEGKGARFTVFLPIARDEEGG